uniref:Uncharacterized protein n=1 Tax=viral metagenome TaxID=1070528 RepID=A0A6C0DQH5_9ZZZZ
MCFFQIYDVFFTYEPNVKLLLTSYPILKL